MQAYKFIFIFLISMHPLLGVSASPSISSSASYLTLEEKAFIKSHPTIRVANEMDWPAFDYNQNGIPKGFSIDYINLLLNKVGLKIEYVNGYTWSKLLTLFQQKKIDVLPAVYKDTNRQNYTLFTTAYYQIKLGIFANKDNQIIEKEQDLSQKKVGIGALDASISLIEKRNPNINLIEVDSSLELIKMLSTKALDAVIISPLVFNFYQKEAQINNIYLADEINLSRLEQKTISLHFGIRKDWSILHSILQKLIDRTTNKEMRNIKEKWIEGISGINDNSNKAYLSRQEQKFLASNSVIKVHMEDNYTPFSNIENNNKFIGYSIDYANMVADRLGIQFHYNKNETWNQALSHLKSKQTDIIAQMINTKDRQRFALFSDNYMTYYQAIIIKKENIHLDTIRKLQGKRVAIVKGYDIEKILKKKYPKVQLIRYPDNQTLLNAVRLNKVDAAISTHQVVQYNINALFLNDIISIPILNNPDIKKISEAFAIRNDWPLMHSALQKAFASISTEEVTELQRKWFGQTQNYSANPSKVVLSAIEKDYLSKKNQITLCIDPNWMPFEKIEAGEHKGMSADYFNLIKKELPIPFQLIPTSSWAQSLGYMRAKKCDILPLVASTASREKYINFTSAYWNVPIVIATKTNVPFIANFNNLGDKKIGVAKDYAFIELLKSNYPELYIVAVENRKIGLEKVIDGELFGFVGSLFGIGYMFQTQFIGELKIAGKFDQNLDLSIGVRDDDTILLGILEKFVKHIDDGEKQQIINKQFSIKYEKRVDYTLVWQILSMALILLTAILYWNRKLKISNNKLEESQQQLIEQAHRDPLTNLYNRRYFHEMSSEILRLSKRSDILVSTIMIDIDKFKKINDSYGHNIGDDVLKKLALLLKMQTRASDIVARFGGEEFVILLPNTDKQGASKIAENLRALVEKQSLKIDNGKDLKYTISLGVDSVNVNDDVIDLSLNRADEALYQAKNSGRNRIILSA